MQSTLALRTPAFTDIPLLWTDSESPAKIIDDLLKQTPAITDSRYYGITDTLSGPDVTILLSSLSL